MSKHYKPGTVGNILADRLADLLDDGSIGRDDFVELCLANVFTPEHEAQLAQLEKLSRLAEERRERIKRLRSQF